MRAPATALLMGAALLTAWPASAQERADPADGATGRIMGRVLDAGTDQPIEGASVRLSDFERFNQVTDSRGAFSFTDVPHGVREIAIEHIAYGSGTHLVYVPGGETVTFDAQLEAGAIQLDALVITARVRATQLDRIGFHRRARLGFGHFFSGSDVASDRIREVLYRVPRLEFVQERISSRRVIIRGARGSCVPDIVLDGMRQTWAEGDIETVVMGRDLEAIEVYRGITTPGEFSFTLRGVPCGAIVVWTRR